MSRLVRNPLASSLQGSRAGFASRVAADVIDVLISFLIYIGILVGIAFARFLVGHEHLQIPEPSLSVTVTAEWVILVLYLFAGWAGTGRTLCKTLLGVRVVTRKGKSLPPRRAFARAVLCATFGVFTLPWCLVSRKNLAIHDIALRTSVVHDWITKT